MNTVTYKGYAAGIEYSEKPFTKILLGVVIALFFCTSAWAESSVWKAQKGKTTVYLGGTCHVLRESDYPLPAEFEKAYKASDIIVFETDIRKLQDPATQQSMMVKAMYTDGTNLRNHLSPEVYQQLQTYCNDNQIPLVVLNKLKPSMVMLTLIMMDLMKLGITEQGVDRYFHDRAVGDLKRTEALETVAQQIDYFVTMSDGNEDQFVTYSLRDISTLEQNFKALAKAWRKGDLNQLNDLMLSDLMREQPQVYKKLITSRNNNWLKTISAYDKKPGTRFVLVGVGHLAGRDGLLESLRRNGYSIEQL